MVSPGQPQPVSVLKLQDSFALYHRHPLVPVLVVPCSLRCGLTVGDDALYLDPALRNKVSELLIPRQRIGQIEEIDAQGLTC